jgi:hypothetical protein
MNEQIVLALSFLILLFPFLINQFMGVINALGKTTINSPVSYINTSIIKVIVKSFSSKLKLDSFSYFIYFFILFFSLLANSLSWLAIFNEEYIVSIYSFSGSILLFAILISLTLKNSAKRLNITDYIIEYQNFHYSFITRVNYLLQGTRKK